MCILPEIYKSLELKFTNQDATKSKSVFFQIDPHSLAQRWAAMLIQHLNKKSHLEKNYLLHGWLGSGRDLEYLCAEMNRHIDLVNKAFAPKPKGYSYYIDQNFNYTNVDQNQLNQIHHHFELLIGRIWSPAPYYASIDERGRHSVRQLNNLCHEIENYTRSENSFANQQCNANLIASFLPTTRAPLIDEDYNHFNLRLRFGDVHLHYAQLGKTHLEAYCDRDEIIHGSNINGLRYLSGEFDISFCTEPSDESYEELVKSFRKWMINNNLDPDQKSLAIGFARVARLDKSNFSKTTQFDILNELFTYSDIQQITVHSDKRSYHQKYHYSWRDGDLEKKQTSLIHQTFFDSIRRRLGSYIMQLYFSVTRR